MLTHLTDFFTSLNISKEVIVFLVSMFPVIELRGGIIAASLFKIPVMQAYFICLLGNMIPIPFILFFIKKIFKFLKKFKLTEKIIVKLETKALKKSESVKSKQLLGLFLFVAIPLPGTGGWTGALIASLLNMPIKDSFVSIFLGVASAGVIMILISYFVPGLFGF